MKRPRLTEQTKDRLASLARFIVLIPMIFIGKQVYGFGHNVWADYWLSKDAKTVNAFVIQTHPKQIIDYRYTVDGKEYAGTSWRAWEDEKIHALQAGETTTVLVSASHPWLSSLQTTRLAWAALPLVVLMLLLGCFCVAVIVDPKGRWSVSRWFLYGSGGPQYHKPHE